MKFVVTILVLILSCGAALPAEESAPAPSAPPIVEEQAQPDPARCEFSGYKLGIRPDPKALKDRRQFFKMNPDSISPPTGGASYMVLGSNTKDFRQFIFIFKGEVITIVRQYDDDQEGRLLVALKERYGEPRPVPAVPRVKSDTGFGGGTVSLVSNTLWVDPLCALDLELIRENQTVIAPFYSGTHFIITLVITDAVPEADAGDSPLLK